MPTSAAIKVARGRAAKIEALETAYTDGPGDRDEQAKCSQAWEGLVNTMTRTRETSVMDNLGANRDPGKRSIKRKLQ